MTTTHTPGMNRRSINNRRYWNSENQLFRAAFRVASMGITPLLVLW